MIHRVLLDTAETPDGGKELRLYQHDKDFFILAENEDLMSSRMHESEDQLARITTERITHRKQPSVLIGGLGMGFTLRAALDGLPESAKVVVAELVPAVVNWNRGLLAHLAGNPLADKRVEIQEIDVAKILRKTKNHYDAILLDVDNGPSGLSRKSNDWFYGMSGLYAARGALKSGGLLGIWSAAPDREFENRLRIVDFEVEGIRVRSRPGGKGAHHHLWIACKK
jgi:spermidine synthase